jgi:haloalkane dehalogenase
MDFLDTPEHRFAGLSGYPFEPSYAEVESNGMRMHYVDEGPKDAPPVLMLHGEPSWSYLYRFMIPPLVDAGFRVIVPDLIGFGRSSKPTKVDDYTFARHCDWMRRFIERLDLRDVTLFAQDWGSLIGLRMAAELEERFARVVIGNGFLPTGDPVAPSLQLLGNTAAFLAWRTFALYSPWFVMSQIINFGSRRDLTREERRAYDAPFPDKRYLAGARAFPALVPMTPRDPARDDCVAAWKVLARWEKPFLTVFSTGDPIMRGLDKLLQKRIPGARGQAHDHVRGGHFLQEDSGPELARRIIDFVRNDTERADK